MKKIKRLHRGWEGVFANHVLNKELVSNIYIYYILYIKSYVYVTYKSCFIYIHIYIKLLLLSNKKKNNSIKIGQRIYIDISLKKIH